MYVGSSLSQNFPTRIVSYFKLPDAQCLQMVIDRVNQWYDEYLLPLNVDKCKGMSFTSNITTDTS